MYIDLKIDLAQGMLRGCLDRLRTGALQDKAA